MSDSGNLGKGGSWGVLSGSPELMELALEISLAFINPAKGVLGELFHGALEQMCGVMGGCSAALLTLCKEGDYLYSSYAFHAEGYQPEYRHPGSALPVDGWCREMIAKGDVISVEDLVVLSPKGRYEVKFMTGMDTGSFLASAVRVRGELAGFVAMAAPETGYWTTQHKETIGIISLVFGSALALESVLETSDKARMELELSVAERTRELTSYNLQLQAEISQRRRMVRELQTAAIHLKTVVSQAQVIIFTIDSHGILTFAEGGGLASFGEDGALMIGRSVFEVFARNPRMLSDIKRALTGAEFRSEISIRRMTFDVGFTPIRDQFGEVESVIGVAFNITRRMDAEKALRDSEARFQRVIEASSTGIWDWEIRTNEIYFSPRWKGMLGYGDNELLNDFQVWVDLIHPEDRAGLLDSLDDLVRTTAHDFVHEFRMLHRSGRYRWFSNRSAVFKDESGMAVRVAGSQVDITPRKEMEEILRQSEARFRRFFELGLAGLAVVSPKGGTMQVNDRLCEILGYSRDELLVVRWQEITHPDDVDEDREKFREMVRGSTDGYSMDKRFFRRNGDVVHAYLSVKSVLGPEGRMEYALALVEDISWRKRAELEQERLKQELTVKNRELEQVVYVTSHDLRSPLVNIQGFTRELKLGMDDLALVLKALNLDEQAMMRIGQIMQTDIVDSLQYIMTSTSKMDRLLRGLLTVSRMGRTALQLESLDMDGLVATVVEEVSHQARYKGATIQVEPLPRCRGDELQISQLFSNLIGNGIKYLEPSRAGLIKVSGQVLEGRAVFLVEDNGIGIQPDHIGNIFNLFHRLNPAGCEGEGLGLAIVKMVVERHKGSIEVESQPGVGSCFRIFLPLG